MPGQLRERHAPEGLIAGPFVVALPLVKQAWIMKAIDLHSEIIDMVKRTGDVGFLTWIRNVLRDGVSGNAQDADLLEMAQRSEEAIERGEVYTHEEAIAYLKAVRKKREGR